jgi:hypothetical protein
MGILHMMDIKENMKIIIISPYSQKMREGSKTPINPKNYPYWQEVIDLIYKEYIIIQIGITNDILFNNIHESFLSLKLSDLRELVNCADLLMSIDNFFTHFCHFYFPHRKGIVLWGKSDPKIFGYDHNINLIKDRKYLRNNQFDIWESEFYDKECFVKSSLVVDVVSNLLT